LTPHIHSSTDRPGRSSQTANPTGTSSGLLSPSSSSSSSHSTSSTSSHLISPLAATYFSLPTSNSQPPSDPSRFGATILGDYLIPPYAENQFLSQVLAPYSHNPSDEVQYNTKIAALWTSLFKRKLGPPTEPFVDWQTDQDLGNSKARDGTVYAQTWMQEVVRSVRREFGLLTESSAVASRRSGHSDSPLALGKSTPRLISRSSPLPIFKRLNVHFTPLHVHSLTDLDRWSTLGGQTSVSSHQSSYGTDGIRRPDFIAAGQIGRSNLRIIGVNGEHKAAENNATESDRTSTSVTFSAFITELSIPQTRKGLAAAMVQLLSEQEAFGTYLGYFLMSTHLCRMIAPTDRMIVLECQPAFRSALLGYHSSSSSRQR